MSLQFNLVNRLRSLMAVTPDNTVVKNRANHLGESIVSPLRMDQLAEEGSLFVSVPSNWTVPGTGVAINAAAFAATTPALIVKNTNALGGKNIVLKRLRMVVTAAGTGTAMDAMVVVDTTNRMPTSGGVVCNNVNARSDETVASGATILHGGTAMVGVSAPTSTARMIDRLKIKQAAPVVGDTFAISFGGEPTTEAGLLSGAAAALFAINAAPVVVPPGAQALIYLWGVNPSVESVLHFYER